jgi:general secretion pathway protein A
MYLNYYGLKQKPFDLAPLGGLVFLSEAHQEGLATLRYGVISNKIFLLLTGGVGTGKTTVLNTLLGMIRDNVLVCTLNNPTLLRKEFYNYLAGKLGLKHKNDKGIFILQFTKLLQEYEKKGGKILLIFDEAQAIPVDILEEIRLLSNHAEQKNVLSIFLIGQPELQDKLNDPKLLPLTQRIGIRYHLQPLTRDDTAQYIFYRLSHAGANNLSIFNKEAVDLIHKASSGNPRLINIICDNAMLLGYSKEVLIIDRAIIRESLELINLHEGAETPVTPKELDDQAMAFVRKKKGTSSWFLLKVLVAVGLLFIIGAFLAGSLNMPPATM